MAFILIYIPTWLYLENEEEQNLSQLSRFLEEVSLVADIDNLEEDTDHVVLMTLHSAKGLEFLNVYLAGMEDGLFPSFMAISTDMDSSELEEERRLCYVGITRAREKLTLTAAKKRMVRGEIQYASISRFVKEIPKELIEGNLWEPKPKEYAFGTAMDFGEQTTDKGTNGYGKYKASAGKLKNMPTAAAAYSHKTAARNFGTSIQKKSLDYREKDRVKHIKFGEGTVKSIVDGGRDFEVTVDFDRVGVKKMFASFARLQKI